MNGESESDKREISGYWKNYFESTIESDMCTPEDMPERRESVTEERISIEEIMKAIRRMK